MRLGLIFRLFRSAARLEKKRMILTLAAIAWGTVAIVVLLAAGEGLRRSMARGTRGMGEGIAIAWLGETSKPFAGFPAGREIRLVAEDVDLLVANVPEIAGASGEMSRWGTLVSYGGKVLNRKITGVHPAFGAIRYQYSQEGGRFLNRLDFDDKRRVVFLGHRLADELFGDGPAVGETVLLQNVPFTVVGVLIPKQQNNMYGGPDASQGVIPLSTFQATFGRRSLGNLVYKPVRPELMDLCDRRLREVLGAKYRFDPTDERVFPTWNTQNMQRSNDDMMLGIEIFLGVVGALTLLIGGVGVANIMYAAVKQRTPEIGILMALGARRGWVVGPLVLEALTLTLLGGLLGLVAGIALVDVLAWLQSNSTVGALVRMGEPTFSPPLVLLTIALLGVLGFLSGYFPARRATLIQPASVLRDE